MHPASPTLTIFSAPRAFVGPAATTQRNAVWSWTQLGEQVEVILIGDEEGIESTSRELGTRHLADVARSPAGVPLLDDVFRRGQDAARGQICMFINADIILGPDVLTAMSIADRWSRQFLLVGQRWDTPIDSLLERRGSSWWRETRAQALSEGRLNSPRWIDYFAFPSGQYEDLPPFIIGRPGYDNWMIWYTRSRAIPVIDASDAVVAIHQRHDYAHVGQDQAPARTEDARTNADLIGDRRRLFTIGDATHRLTSDGIARARGSKYVLARVRTWGRPVIDATAPVRRRVGFDSELVQRMTAPLRRRQLRRQR